MAVRLQKPLSVVTPTVDGDVLTALARTDRSFTTGELHRLIGEHSHAGIRKVLLRLVDEGIVTSQSIGGAKVYRLNQDHLAAAAIKELASLRQTYLERVREVFAAWDPAPVFAAMFGSAARGEMQKSSDIDLFVVRPDGMDVAVREVWEDNLNDLQQTATRWTGNDVRALEMSESEVVENFADEPLLRDIRHDGLVLYGSSGFWRRANAKNRRVHVSDA